MLIRRATAEEMLALWGYGEENAPPTARFFCRNISSGSAVFWALEELETTTETIEKLKDCFGLWFGKDLPQG